MSKSFHIETLEWMCRVSRLPWVYYGTMPIRDLYAIFKNGKGHITGIEEMTEEDFSNGIRMLLNKASSLIGPINVDDAVNAINNDAVDDAAAADAMNTIWTASAGLLCRFYEDEIASFAMSDQDIKSLIKEKAKWNISTYILSFEEVNQIMDNGYVVTSASDALEKYLRKKTKCSSEKVVEILRHLAAGFNSGEMMVTDCINELSHILGTNKPENAFTIEALNEMVQLVIDFYTTVGHRDRGGWAPGKLRAMRGGIDHHVKLDENGLPTGPLPEGVVLMPASTQMANIMRTNEAELRGRGVNIDFGGYSTYSGRVMNPEGKIERRKRNKVYPNDPCPCGSGRKFKHCHGKNR